jgi:hypothetical protein
MPLLDHFRPPLHPTHSWESFHARWAVAIADALNETLPERFFAETQSHLGARAEADVIEFEQPLANGTNGHAGGVLTATYAPPAPALAFAAPTAEDVTVEVRDRERDARVAAVVELLSPRNKDRADARRGFAAQLVAFLRLGIGVVAVDTVTSRTGNPHADLVALLALPPECARTSDTGLSAVAYRPTASEPGAVETWYETLALGADLPTMPLWVRGFGFVPVELEATYTEARARSRV